ncbi:hypothetical protein [Mycobacterium heckeshornense]|uniref:Uncharacterized protein n=1 Tax=Mycobacterium heckeshornense TaxID=110505 RepID=A0A7R7GWA8_9MYCO|nr:hypothetical protein [Mycobacterium heckeshornense]MCV7035289.1 hypothetical protein [Mycobacterium heckeshornense]BCO37089.1 hypothetical protein MHEC_35220 [Mycobacterium heckeshornense]
MQERHIHVTVDVSWHLVWIFALLEGITVPLVPLFSKNGSSIASTGHAANAASWSASFAKNATLVGIYGIAIGFIGTVVICLVLNYIAFRIIKVDVNNAAIMRMLQPFTAGVWGGLLLAVIFLIQFCIGYLLVLSRAEYLVICGFVSVAGAFIVTGATYLLTIKAVSRLGIQLVTTTQRLLLVKFPLFSFAILAGLYEGLAALILQRWELVHQYQVLIALVTGSAGGAFGSLMVVTLAHLGVVKKHLWLEFSVMAQ